MKKKLFTALGIAALAAATVPFTVRKSEYTGETSIHALLWNMKVKPDPENPNKPEITVNVGQITNPFKKAYNDPHQYDDMDLEFISDEEASYYEVPADVELTPDFPVDPEGPDMESF